MIAASIVFAVPDLSHAAATIVIVNKNNPNEGFNDPTAVAPVGGNAGTTVGQQRLLAFKYAATIWSAALNGRAPVRIQASFTPLSCTATMGVLGIAGPTVAWADTSFPLPNVWYPGALANQFVGQDLDPATPPIEAQFNSSVGSSTCLTGDSWYYGLDGNVSASNQLDLVTVVLHEFAHGLGFVTLTDTQTGAQLNNQPDVWEYNMFDLVVQKHWNMMSDAERAASSVRPRKLVWDGLNVTAAVPTILRPGTPSLTVQSPPSIAGDYLVGTALFGPSLTSAGVSGNLQAPLDAAGSTTGCTAPLPSLSGAIALLDRGGNCNFTVKVKNAQNAGAAAAIIVDNVPGSPPAPMGGVDATITIPSVRISQNDGARIRTVLSSEPVIVSLLLPPTRRGADDHDRALLYTPDPYMAGSSVTHTDPSATLLMDPAYDTSLGHNLDLTTYLLEDIGWSVATPNPGQMSADLAITVSGPSSYRPGSDVSYKVTVGNNGPASAPDVEVFNTAPAGLSFKSTEGDCTTGLPCALGEISPRANKSFTVTFSVPSSYQPDGSIQLMMNVAAPVMDPVLSNNVANVVTPLGSGSGCTTVGDAGEPTLFAALLLCAVALRITARRAGWRARQS